MTNKDVIYVESGSDIPFITFGSRAVKNLVLNCEDFWENSEELLRVNYWNRGIISINQLKSLLELISRVGFVEVEWVDVGEDPDYDTSFFNLNKTKKLMEAWDD